MELDETDPAIWLKMEAATQEFIESNFQAFKDVCDHLVPPYINEEKWSDKLKSQQFPIAKPSNTGLSCVSFFCNCLNGLGSVS